MIYDQIELMKMNISEDSIQKMRDHVKDALIKAEESDVVFFFDVNLLQFVIDMVSGYKVLIQSSPYVSIHPNVAEIRIYKKQIS